MSLVFRIYNNKEESPLKMKKYEKLINIISMVFAPVLIFYLFEWYMRNPFEKMNVSLQILNIFFFEFLLYFLIGIFGKIKVAIRVEAVLAIVVGLADYFVIQFRSTSIMPWDIFSIGTAASVANNYKYHLNARAVIVTILLLLIIVSCRWLKLTIGKKLPVRLLFVLAGFLMLFGFTKFIQRDETVKTFRIYDKLFTPTTMSYKDGTVVAFLMEMKYMKVDKPANYSNEKAETLLSTCENKNEITSNQPTPNVIVIMNEAFSDLSILDDYTTNTDEIPFMRFLMNNAENTVSGYMDVSVLGGNTANTEFEFLTGDSMAFLPQGSIPYQQYVNSDTSSLASYFKGLGYSTIAMHPYRAAGWDRDKVYPRFGFDQFYSQDDFTNPDILRKYISDKADVDKIKEIYETKEKGTPLFLFNVTMQNHSSYTDSFDNFIPEISVENSDSEALNNYLSLLKKSDESLEDIITYFENQDEDTILVFFGDHQPTDSVVAPIYQMNGRSVYSLTEEETRMRYKVPFIIWANYDIQEETNLTMSANLLGSKMLTVAGMQKGAYANYLSSLYTQFPSVSAMQITDAAGKTTSVSEQKDLLSDYQMLQYYHLFQ